MGAVVPAALIPGVAVRGRPHYLIRMNQTGELLHLLLIRTTLAASEVMEVLLEEKGALGTAIERRRGARLVRLQAYFPPDVELPIAWAQERLADLHANGVPVGPAEVRGIPLHREDWAESWKRHFHAQQVTPRLWIVPTWESQPEGAREWIRLDPGMAFGQGDHPTTHGCLQMMERLDPGARLDPRARLDPGERPVGERAVSGDSLVPSAPGPLPSADVGCGTGILSIRAIQLGLGPVDAFDTEAEAVRAARENAGENNVAGGIAFHSGGFPAHGVGPYRYVFANIFLGVLLDYLPRFSRAVAPGGELLAAGLLLEQEERFLAEAQSRGFKVVDRICEPAGPGARRWPILRLSRLS
jgi:ribosomal protein L11 methyltransferase